MATRLNYAKLRGIVSGQATLTMPFPPLRLEPIFKPALWGGHRLPSLFGRPSSPDLIGEAWLASDLPGSSNTVADGPLRGTSLRTLMRDARERLIGRSSISKRFPLLLKLIDARQHLSVQVHPNDALARKLEGPTAVGKTEAWLLLDADPSARIFAGLVPGTNAASLTSSIRQGEIERVIASNPSSPGDIYYLRAGTVHAIGAGNLLFEVQQPSDITYRLYDWGRLDAKTGLPRELHLEKGLQAVNYEEVAIQPQCPTDDGRARQRSTPLVESPYFRVSEWSTDQPFRVGRTGSCRVLVCLDGVASLIDGDHPCLIEPFSVWVLPAEIGERTIHPRGMIRLLECSPRHDV